MFGSLEIFMFVKVGERSKRVMLAKVPCAHRDAEETLAEFRKANGDRVNRDEVHAEFKLLEFIG
jgi:hypothetical protein